MLCVMHAFGNFSLPHSFPLPPHFTDNDEVDVMRCDDNDDAITLWRRQLTDTQDEKERN